MNNKFKSKETMLKTTQQFQISKKILRKLGFPLQIMMRRLSLITQIAQSILKRRHTLRKSWETGSSGLSLDTKGPKTDGI